MGQFYFTAVCEIEGDSIAGKVTWLSALSGSFKEMTRCG